MGEDIPPQLLGEFTSALAEQLGLAFPPSRWNDLWRGMAQACRELGFDTPGHCMDALRTAALDRRQIETLAGYLTVGETYFFREPRIYHALKEHVLPDLLRTHQHHRRSLRFWSAGCATGEEPYSLAMLLDQMGPDLQDWQITILATDINPQFLSKAHAGVYTQWSFRGLSPRLKAAYFHQRHDDQYEICPRLRERVTFACLNLAEDIYPSLLNNTNAMDLILCRNVLMYFVPEVAYKVIRNFHLCLAEGGWLSASPTDLLHLQLSPLQHVTCAGATFYRKLTRRAGPSPVPPRPAVLAQQPLPAFAAGAPATPSARRPVPASLSPQPAPPPSLESAAERLAQGAYAQAAELAAAFLERHRRDTAAMELLARANANQGRLPQALEWCDRAIREKKLDPAFHLLRASILQEQGRPADAIASLQRVLYLDPNFVMAHFALGNLLQQQGNSSAAALHFRQALALLRACDQDVPVPASEGITAGRLRQILETTLHNDL